MTGLLRPIPYRATLRIYEPITSFNEEERSRYEKLSANPDSYLAEDRQTLIRTILGVAPKIAEDGVHIFEQNSVKYISPWKSAIRTLRAYESFKNEIPQSLLPYFVPNSLANAISAQSELIEYTTPYALEETWMIPPRWFALFNNNERTQGAINSIPFVYYRAAIKDAIDRCRFSHNSVVNAFGNGPIEQEIENLLLWLESFHPDSIVELDYGGLAYYLEKSLLEAGERGLIDDSSVDDLQNSLAGLASGDGTQAGIGYERLIKRWRRLATIEQSM